MNDTRIQGKWEIEESKLQSNSRIKGEYMKFGEEQIKLILQNDDQPKIQIKVENKKNKITKLDAKFELINKDSDKNTEFSQILPIDPSDSIASIAIPLKSSELIHFVDCGKLVIRYDISYSSSSDENVIENSNIAYQEQHPNYDAVVEKNEKWVIPHFDEHAKNISSNFDLPGLEFQLKIQRPDDYLTTSAKFQVEILCNKIIDKSKRYTFQIQLVNETPEKTLQRVSNYNFEKEGDQLIIDFDLPFKDFTSSNGFLSEESAIIKFRYSNSDFTITTDEDSSDDNDYKTNDVYDITNTTTYPTTSYSVVSYDSSKKNTGYVGLKNQGATCYMNSMLQSLFHIPAFRRLVYRMHTTGTEDVATSIPLCLQRLFVCMQCSDKACSTKALTKSFGWDDYQTIVQHDVQEFCRVLLDNLEEKMKGTELDGQIPKLFRGKFRSFIRCINIDYETSKEEEFYDLQLVVKDIPDLATSFEKYVEPEILDGDNQYNVEGHGKQDVKMGIEFVEFPSILHLHLRRFEYDYNFDTMTKINSKFEFPASIDLSPYLAKNADLTKSNVFDLYGVLVHNGSPTAGHYYAFLRTTTGPQWYQFNDSTISTATVTEAVDENFGGQSTTSAASAGSYMYGGHSGYSTYSYEKNYSAYMLVYVRREDAARIFTPVTDAEIPEHLKNYFKEHPESEETTSYYGSTKSSSPETKFVVAPEEGIRVNLVRGKNGFDCKEMQKTFTLNKNTDNCHTIYEKVAALFNIDINKFRLWTAYSKFTPYSIVKDTTSDFPYYTDLLLQMKPEDEDVDQSDKVLVLMKFFDLSLPTPLHYLGSTFVERSSEVSQLYPKVLEILGLPDDLSDKLTAFLEYSSDYVNELKPNAAISYSQTLVFQFPQPTTDEEKSSRIDLLNRCTFHFFTKEDLPTLLAGCEGKNGEEEEKDEEKEKEKKEKEEEVQKSREPYKDLPFYDYTKVIGEQKFADFAQYIKSFKEPIYAILFDYEDVNKPIGQIQFSPSIFLDQLKQFIVKALNLDYNPDQDVMLVYKKSYYSDEPNSDPIQTESLSNEFYTYNNNIHRIYFRLIKNMTKEKLDTMMTVDVSISLDGFSVSKKKLLVDKDSTLQTIKDKIIEVAKLNPDDFTDRTSCLLSYIKDHRYEKEYADMSEVLQSYENTIRFDVISQEQRDLILSQNDEEPQSVNDNGQHFFSFGQNNKLFVFGAHITTEYSRTKNCGDPFMFILDKNESYDDFRNRIKESLKLDDSFKRCKILFDCNDPDISHKTPFMKADKNVGEYLDSLNLQNRPTLFIFHLPHQTSSKNEAVKIMN